MQAITVEPKKAGSAQLEDVPEPDMRDGAVLVGAIAVGVCGTDVEIVEGKYGWAPPGKTRLVLGHESLGRVVDPGPAGGLTPGDLVVGIVRRPDPIPCPNCAVRAWRCWGLCRHRHLLHLKVHVRIPALKNGAQLPVQRAYSRL